MRCSLVASLKFFGYFVAFLVLRIAIFAFYDLRLSDTSSSLWSFLLGIKPEVRYASDKMTSPVLTVPCGDLSDYDGLIIVHSSVSGFQRRHDYRMTYGNPEFTKPRRMKVVFLLGLPSDPPLQELVEKEYNLFQDLVQGHFVDAYVNLTYKAVMGFRWISEECSEVNVVIKMDDDVILDVNRFFEEFWPPVLYTRQMIHCHMWEMAEVERVGKWMLTKQEVHSNVFPPYCSGFLVVIPFYVTHELYRIARSLPFVWVDDAFIYGIVRKASGIVQIVDTDVISYDPKELNNCIKDYGPRCKFVGALIDRSDPFLASLMAFIRGSPRSKKQ